MMDIEERLDQRNFPYGYYSVMAEAKAEIKRLRADKQDNGAVIAGLQGDIERLQLRCNHLEKTLNEVWPNAQAEIENLRAELEVAAEEIRGEQLLVESYCAQRDELLALLRSALHHVISEGDDTLATIICAAFTKAEEK